MLPLKRKVEDFLRLNIHCMLIEKLEGTNPYKQEMSDLVKMIQFEKISIFDTKIDLKIEISKAFNETFYNMNTINIYDMETYEQMRIMANYLFGLNLHDVYLPNQTVSQGKFDIFTIIRNIPKFISTYNYNLLSQKFLEITCE
jgi:WASH complex subunit 7